MTTVVVALLGVGEALAHTKKKLEEATSSIEKAQLRGNVLTRKLKTVEQVPEPEAAKFVDMTVDPQADESDAGMAL